MTTHKRILLTAVALTLGLPRWLAAVGEGRLIATVRSTTDGKPVQGAKATLTRPGTGYHQEKTSDGEGRLTLLVLDATQEYQLVVEKEGYTPSTGPLKLKPGDVMRMDVTLAPLVTTPTPPPSSPHDDAIAAYNEGVASLQKGDLAAALPHVAQAATLDPQLAEAQVALAEIQLALHHPADALAAADRYLALRPGDERGLRDRLDALVDAGDAAKAQEAVAALLAADTKDLESAVRFYNAGAERTRARDNDGAVRFFERATQIAPDDPRFAKAHYVVGAAYAGDETKKALARQHLEKFLQLAPDDPDAAAAREMLGYLK